MLQWAGGIENIRLLRDKWRGKVDITTQLLEFPDMRKTHPECAEPPLSWKLTDVQNRCIDLAWNEADFSKRLKLTF